MTNCERCYYYDKCTTRERCEYYDPVLDVTEDESEDNIVLNEYLINLVERAHDYNEIEREMNQ